MLPILLHVGPITIFAYGVFLSLGIFAGLYWFWKIGRDEHWEETKLFDMYFVSIFTYFLLGRIGYVLLHPELYSLGKAISLLSHPGIMNSVGILGTILVIILMAHHDEWELWKALDAWVVVLSTILVVGSVGAVLNGSTPGVISATLGYIHPGDTVARIPVDIWTFIWSLITFGVVSRVRKNFRFYSWYKGEASVAKDGLAAHLWGVMVGVYYFVAGLIREGSHYGIVPVMSFYSLIGIITLLAMIYWRGGKNRGEILLSHLHRKGHA